MSAGGEADLRRYGTDAAVVVAYAVIATAFWKWRLIDPATVLVATPATFANTANTDIFTQTYPMWQRAAQLWASGEPPLWNPFQYGGHPFLATALYGVLYPPNLLVWRLPTAIAIEVANLAHLCAAGVFTYLFGRGLELSRSSAALMGLTFMLSGFVAAETAWFPPAIASATWLPLGLLAIDRIVAHASFRAVTLLAVAITMSALGGWIQTWVYSLYALGAYATVRLGSVAMRPGERQPNPSSIAALLAAGFALGLGLAAVQLLPTLELMALGPRRPGALSLEYTLILGTTPPMQLAREMTDGSPGYPRFAYVGLLALLLSPVGISSAWRQGRTLFFAVLALGSLAVALTIHTPALTLYRWLPAAAWFRKPQRILFLYAVAASALTGIGFQAVRRRALAARPWWHGVRPIAVAVALVASLLAVAAAPLRSWIYLTASTILLIGFAARPAPSAQALLTAALFALPLCDLGGAARNPYLHPLHGTRSLDAAEEIFDYVRQHQGLQRTYLYAAPFDYALMAKQGTLRGIYSITDYEPLSLSSYQGLFDMIAGPGDAKRSLLTFTGALMVAPDNPRFGALDLFGVRYLVAHRQAVSLRAALAAVPQSWHPVMTSADGEYLLFERTQPLPRAYVAHRVSRAVGTDEVLRALSAPGFDATRTVVLELGNRHPALPVDSDSPIQAATIESYEPRRVVVVSDDPEPGWLVLTDTDYPGWRAEVDGRPVEIARANRVFRAVPLSTGHHRIVFTYRPTSLALGLSLTAAALLLVMIGLARSRRAL